MPYLLTWHHPKCATNITEHKSILSITSYAI